MAQDVLPGFAFGTVDPDANRGSENEPMGPSPLLSLQVAEDDVNSFVESSLFPTQEESKVSRKQILGTDPQNAAALQFRAWHKFPYRKNLSIPADKSALKEIIHLSETITSIGKSYFVPTELSIVDNLHRWWYQFTNLVSTWEVLL
jgi:hypothetical protein